eukprot:gb/GECG01008961.1/.p1 GENE.gb/GECG01008961.1/~~gb/GECG01008961.1/.p1  ORF type:complete len:381 (+),score=60.24 gb/GECG01008961.1/:1-1143(+)
MSDGFQKQKGISRYSRQKSERIPKRMKGRGFIWCAPTRIHSPNRRSCRMERMRRWARANCVAGRFLRPNEFEPSANDTPLGEHAEDQSSEEVVDSHESDSSSHSDAERADRGDSHSGTPSATHNREEERENDGKSATSHETQNVRAGSAPVRTKGKVSVVSGVGIDAVENQGASAENDQLEDDFFLPVDIESDALRSHDTTVDAQPDLSAAEVDFKEESKDAEDEEGERWKPGEYAPKHTIHVERYRDSSTKREQSKASLTDEQVVENALRDDDALRKQYYKLSGRKRKRLERGIIFDYRKGGSNYFDSQYGTDKDTAGIAGRNKRSAVSKVYSQRAKLRKGQDFEQSPQKPSHAPNQSKTSTTPERIEGAAPRQHLQFD